MRPLLAGILVLSASFPTLFGQDAAAPTPTVPAQLTVVIKPANPFVFDNAGAPSGYSIDLWKRVAQEAGVQFEFKTVAKVTEVIDALRDKSAQIGVGALSVTAEREAVIDFSHPIYESGLQILASAQAQSSIFEAFRGAFKADVLKVIGILFLALVGNAHILWFLERRRNPDSFPEAYPHGVIEALWWSICTIMTGGCENKAPSGHAGRLLAIAWMLAGIGLVSYVTATLSASLTFNKFTSDIKGLGDLQNVTTGTVAGSASASFLERRKLAIKGYDTLDAACAGLTAGEVKAVVYDVPLLRYYLSQNQGSNLQLVGDAFERQNYAFALQRNSPLLKKINLALTRLMQDGTFEELDRKYFAPAPQ